MNDSAYRDRRQSGSIDQSGFSIHNKGGIPTAALIFALAGLAALGVLSTNIILPAFPDIGHSLGISSRDLTVTLSSFFISYAFGQLLVGPISDQYGRKLFVVGGLAIFLVGSVVCATATNLNELIMGRIIQGFGACATAVLARAIARDLFDGEGLTRALSLIMIATAAAPGFSPILGSVFNDLAGWRSMFWFVGFFGLLLGGHYFVRIGETHLIERRSKISFVATLLAYLQLMINRQFIVPAVSVSLVMAGIFTFFATAPTILLESFGFSSLGLGVYFALTVLVVFAAGAVAPYLARLWTSRAATLAGIALALGGGIAMLLSATNLIAFTTALSMFLFGVGIANPLGSALALQPFARQAGTASALFGFLQMGSAAVAIHLAAKLALPLHFALAVVFTASSTAALVVLLTGVRR
ncbi:MAG: multidrug effflux MFS transporter [Alcaligenes aquatilis]